MGRPSAAVTWKDDAVTTMQGPLSFDLRLSLEICLYKFSHVFFCVLVLDRNFKLGGSNGHSCIAI